jgi:hypothetical protein
MNTRLDPKKFGLPARTVIEQYDEDTIAIVVERKSRIIMADGRKIRDKAQKIQKTMPEMKVVLKTTAPLCSRTRLYLEDTGIQVVTI